MDFRRIFTQNKMKYNNNNNKKFLKNFLEISYERNRQT